MVMRSCRAAVRRLLVIVPLIAVAACSGGSSTGRAVTTRAGHSEPSFFAVDQAQQGDVVEVSAETGRVLRSLIGGGRHGRRVSGLSRLDATHLLVTFATGPACTSGVNGCGPRPGTCGAEVDRLDIATGRLGQVWSLPVTVRLTSAQASPDGRDVAALVAPCVPSYFNDHLVVRRLSNGRTWTIGAGVARCHSLSPASWSPDAKTLLVTYAPPAGKTPYAGSDGTCTTPGVPQLRRLDAHQDQPLFAGQAVQARTGCVYQASSTGSTGTYAVEACGRDGGLHGPAASPAQPVTRLQRLDQDTLTDVRTIPGGTAAFTHLTW
jgi:hypothetical protein